MLPDSLEYQSSKEQAWELIQAKYHFFLLYNII